MVTAEVNFLYKVAGGRDEHVSRLQDGPLRHVYIQVGPLAYQFDMTVVYVLSHAASCTPRRGTLIPRGISNLKKHIRRLTAR